MFKRPAKGIAVGNLVALVDHVQVHGQTTDELQAIPLPSDRTRPGRPGEGGLDTDKLLSPARGEAGKVGQQLRRFLEGQAGGPLERDVRVDVAG